MDDRRERKRSRRWARALGFGAALAVGVTVAAPSLVADGSLRAQEPAVDPPPDEDRLSALLDLDADALAGGPFARMNTVLRRTIFRIDVLRLDLRFDASTARRLERLASREEFGDAMADSLAAAALESEGSLARIEFLRGASLRQFVRGIRDNLRSARQAGIVDEDDYRLVSDSLPEWYSFLADRRVRDGDRMLYRIRGDTLRTIYLDADDRVLLDQVDVGRQRVLSVLGGYFAPGSEFRDGLLESLGVRDGG